MTKDNVVSITAAVKSLRPDEQWRFMKWMSTPLRYQVVKHPKPTRANGMTFIPANGGRIMRKKYATMAEAETAANVRNAANPNGHFYYAAEICTKF